MAEESKIDKRKNYKNNFCPKHKFQQRRIRNVFSRLIRYRSYKKPFVSWKVFNNRCLCPHRKYVASPILRLRNKIVKVNILICPNITCIFSCIKKRLILCTGNQLIMIINPEKVVGRKCVLVRGKLCKSKIPYFLVIWVLKKFNHQRRRNHFFASSIFG